MSRLQTVLKNDAAEWQYRHGQTLHNFPIGRFGEPIDGMLTHEGVNVWKDRREELFEQGHKEFPEMTNEFMALRSYFQLRHLNPSFTYDKKNDIAALTYRVFGTDKYFGFETDAATMKALLEEEINRNDKQRQLVKQKNLKVLDGVPSKMIHQGYEYLKQTQYIFESETDVKLENVRDLYENDAQKDLADDAMASKTDFLANGTDIYRLMWLKKEDPDLAIESIPPTLEYRQS